MFPAACALALRGRRLTCWASPPAWPRRITVAKRTADTYAAIRCLDVFTHRQLVTTKAQAAIDARLWVNRRPQQHVGHEVFLRPPRRRG